MAISATESSAQPARKVFTLGGATLSLEDTTTGTGVYFTSMRFNRAANVWNVEVSLTNRTARALKGPFVLLVDSFTGTSGPRQPDGVDESAKAFFDLSGTVLDGELSPGERSLNRTLTLGFTSGAPNLTTRVFVKPAALPAALGLTRTLDDAGQPLPDVQVIESGPLGLVTNRTDPVFGVVTLGQATGAHTWQFSAVGHLPVWRQQTLTTNEVTVVPDPRLVRRRSHVFELTPIAGGQITNTGGAIQINFSPGSVSQNTTATLTPLTGQTLPAFLPLGWSPLQAFCLELASEPAQTATATFTLLGPLANGETAALARWNPASLQWETLQVLTGNGTATLTAAIPGSGAYVVVVGDSAPFAPPAPQVGQALLATGASLPDIASLTATGKVEPSSSPASRVPELVTATATVIISNSAGALPSGMLLRGEVREQYRLSDGTARHPPQYENFIVGYQRPGDSNAATLHASFPLRPLLLFGAEDLDEATVTMDVLTPTPFVGGVLETNGGLVATEGIRVLAGAGDLASRQAAQLRKLAPTNFTDFSTNGATVVGAFEVSVAGVASGRHLVAQFGALSTNGVFVLARVLYDLGFYGLQPLERLTSDSLGRLSTTEPLSGERLAGLIGAGQYLLLQLTAPQGLVSGVARNSAGQPAAGMPVSITGQPWLAFSESNGAFRLLAPTGAVEVAVTDLASGDTGLANITVTNTQTTISAGASTAPTGPRVIGLTPTNGASAVPRVTPVVVTFSEPLNIGTLVGGGLRLLDASNAVVNASLNLNLAGTVATLLPVDPLAPSTLFTIQLSTNITDLTGFNLEGPATFTFTTESDSLNRVGGQFIIYEPTNGLAPVFGTPGSADPESPVILVNETSGQTATILSKPDGSFTNFIAADVDDFISAVLVNQNGTRTTLPASRQIFQDGSVGLFNGGGILEAQSDGGPVQVIVEPGSIANKSKFSVQSLGLSELLALVKNTPPADDGKLLGGLRFKVEGDPLRSPAQIKFPVDVASLDLPPGVSPEQASYAVTEPREVNGVTVYAYVDKMRFGDGHLQTNPGILESAIFFIIKVANGNPLLVTGRAISAVFDSDGVPIVSSIRPVPGAVVLINPSDLALTTPAGVVAPGALVAVAADDGGFAFLTTGGSLAGNFSLLAISPLFPGRLGRGSAAKGADVVKAVATGRVVFDRAAPPPSDAGPDHVPPVISATHFPRNPAVSNTTRLVVLANDDRKISTATVSVQSVTALDPIVPVTTADVTLNIAQQVQSSPQTLRQEYDVTGNKPLRANLLISVDDASSNPQSVVYPIEFGGNGPVLVNPTPNANDTNSPFVVSSQPVIGTEDVMPGTPITITFNEPIDAGFMQNLNLAFQLQPPAGTPAVRLSADKLSVTLNYYSLALNTAYNLLVTPIIQDINGNGLDQNPYNDPIVPANRFESFTLPFHTAALASTPLPGGVVSGGGVVAIGRTLFALDRAGPLDGSLVVVDVSNPGQPVLATQFDLDSFPRDIAAIPRYAYKRTLNGPTETNDLLVIVGGTVANEGQWITVINVTDAAHPVRIASTLATRSSTAALTKLAWSPPLLGYLENDADITSMSLVNLQLFIYARNLPDAGFNNEPANGSPGLDLNGDGDYVDAGESLPRLASSRPRSGLINGGLVTSHTLANETSQRIYDFDLGFGGAFVGVVAGPGKELDGAGAPNGPDVPAQFITLVSGNVRLDRTLSSLNLPVTPKRLTLLLGVDLDLGASHRLANLALVTLPPAPGAQFGKILVVDITNPLGPVLLSDIPVPAQHGIPQSIIRRDDGLLMLATSTDLLLLDPTRLGLPAPTAAGAIHPALVGLIGGMGGGARSFVGFALGGYAVAHGGNNQLRGAFSIANLVLHRPGFFFAPGAAIPDAGEELPFSVIVAVNDDHDDHEFSVGDNNPRARLVNPDAVYAAGTAATAHPPTNDLPDNRNLTASLEDNDLVQLTLGQLPQLRNGKFGFAEVVVQAPETDKPIPVRVLAASAPGGDPFELAGATSNSMNVVTYRVDLMASTPLTPLRGLRIGPVNVYLEGLRPSSPVTVTFRYLDSDGTTVIDQDKVALTVAKVRIPEIWSDQFTNATHNRLPNNAGGKVGNPFSRYPRERNHYLMVGNRADNHTYIKASVQVEPDLPQVRNRVRIALYHHNTAKPDVPLVFGQSGPEQLGNVSALVADDLRPAVFGDYGGDFYYEHFVVGGFDYNGDGSLGLREITQTFGTAYLAGEEMIFSLTDQKAPTIPGDPFVTETRVRIKDDHVKIVNQSSYNKWRAFVVVEAGAGFAINLAFDALDIVLSFLGVSVDVKSVPAFHLMSYAIGIPTQPPDGVEFGNTNITASSELSNNVGADFDSSGQAQIPVFNYSEESGVGADILSSGRYLIHLRLLLENDRKLAFYNHWTANPNVAEADLVFSNVTAGIRFDFEACLGFPNWETVNTDTIRDQIGNALANPGSDCADVFNYGLGIGRANINYQQVKVHVQAAPLPFVRGVTTFTVTSAEVQAVLSDTYDWDLDTAFPLVIIQAGHGTLGDGGKVFKIIIPMDGVVPNFSHSFQ